MVTRLRQWLDATSLRFDIATGRKVWGRQPGPGSGGGMGVTTQARATMTARVVRANGSVEDLGVVSDRMVELTQEQIHALEQAAREQ